MQSIRMIYKVPFSRENITFERRVNPAKSVRMRALLRDSAG